MKTKTLKQATAFCAAALLATGSLAQEPVYESLYEMRKAGVKPRYELADGAVTVTVNKAEVSTRFRVTDSDAQEKLEQLQLGGEIDVSIGVFEDRLVLNLNLGTGSQFNTRFDDTGILDGEEDLNFNLRRLSLTYRPGENVELEVGSMRPDNAGSDMIGISEEGWVTGYKAKVTFEKGSFIVTGGILAPGDEAGVFDADQSGLENIADLNDFNFMSAILNYEIGKVMNSAIQASVGLTHYEDQFYATGALSMNVSQLTSIFGSIPLIDTVSVEGSTTENDGDRSTAWAVSAAKSFEDVIGSKDILAAITYLDRDEGFALPSSEYALEGQSIRLSVSMPNFVERKHFTMGISADYVHSLEDSDEKLLGLYLTVSH